MLTLDRIYQASFALKNVIRRTDLIMAPHINPESNIYLKPENLQITGSFKVRGACFKISQLTEEEKAEQAELRKEYIAAVRKNLRAQLNNIDIKENDGSVINLGEKYGRKKGN